MLRRAFAFLAAILILIQVGTTVATYSVHFALPLSGPSTSAKFSQLASVAQLAASEASNNLPEPLEVVLIDNQGKDDLSMQIALQSGANNSVLALFLSSSPELEYYASLALKSSGESSFSTPSNFFSLAPSQDYKWRVFQSISAYYSWSKVGVIHLDGDSSAVNALLSLGITPTSIPYTPTSTDFTMQFTAVLKDSLQVVLVDGTSAAQLSSILKQANSSSLFSTGRAFIVIGAKSEDVVDPPFGTLFLENFEGVPDNITDFKQKLEVIPSYSGILESGSMIIYDAIHAIAKAIQASLPTVSRANVLNNFRLVSYDGTSGQIAFNQTTQHLKFSYSGFSNVLANGSIVQSLQYNGESIELLTSPIFPGNTTTAPDTEIDEILIAFVTTMSSSNGLGVLTPGDKMQALMDYTQELINTNTSLLPPGKRLKFLYMDDRYSSTTVIQLGISLPAYGVAGIMGAIYSPLSKDLQNVVSAFRIPQLSSQSSDPLLSDHASYPTFIRNIPSDALQGSAIVAMCVANGWTEIALLVGSDAYGAGLSQTIATQVASTGISIISQLNLPTPTSSTNYDEQVQLTKDSQAKVVVVVALPAYIPALIKSMAKIKFAEGTAIVGSSALILPNMAAAAQQAGVDLSFFEGWVTTNPPGGNGPLWTSFLETINSLPNTTRNVRAREALGYGHPYIARTIDAAHIFADAIKRLVLADGDPRNGTQMFQALVSTNLETLTGRTTFDSYGDRDGDFEIGNYLNGKLVMVGRWSESGGYVINTPIVWPDGTTNIPSTSIQRSIEWFKWSHPAAIIFAILAGLGILTSVFMFLTTILQRNSSIIKTATWEFLLLMLIGTAIGYGSILTWIGEPKPYICALRIWLPPIAFILIMAPLLAKTWRLHKIFTLGSLKIAPISLLSLVLIASSLVAVQIVICIFWISFGTIQPVVTLDKNDRTNSWLVCGQNRANRISAYVTYGYVGFLMIVGAYLAFRVRNLPKDFNESRWIGFSIYNTLLFSVIILILGYALASFPVTVAILICVCTFAITTGAVAFMMIPKLWDLLMHPEKRSGGSGSSKSQTKSTPRSGRSFEGSIAPKHDYSKKLGQSSYTPKLMSQPDSESSSSQSM